VLRRTLGVYLVAREMGWEGGKRHSHKAPASGRTKREREREREGRTEDCRTVRAVLATRRSSLVVMPRYDVIQRTV
jgi:hypothetical protein